MFPQLDFNGGVVLGLILYLVVMVAVVWIAELMRNTDKDVF